MRAGPGRQALGQACRLCRPGLQAFSWRPGGFSWRTKPKQNILFEGFSAAFTKKVSKVRNRNHIQLNHRSPAIAVFHLLTRPRLMQADAGFLNHVQAGRLLTQAGPGRP
jgi:hypothetical protein